MGNIETYNKIFIDSFQITEKQLTNLTYQSVPLWDSVGHMALISAIEENFDIMFETNDIIDFSSYKKGIEILKNNYNVQL